VTVGFVVFGTITSSSNSKGSFSKGEFIIFHLISFCKQCVIDYSISVWIELHYRLFFVADSWHCELFVVDWWWINNIRDWLVQVFCKQGASSIYRYSDWWLISVAWRLITIKP
jgi:hypothetical protein